MISPLTGEATPTAALPTAMCAWLRSWRRRTANGRCFRASAEGLELFDGLTPVVGMTAMPMSSDIYDFQGLVHCWLVDQRGVIIDPTMHQYRLLEYKLHYWPFMAQPTSSDKLFSNQHRMLLHLGIGYPPCPTRDPDGARALIHHATGWPLPAAVAMAS